MANENNTFNIDEAFTKGISVHAKVDQQVIITTADKIRLKLPHYFETRNKRLRWISPFSTTTGLLLALLTSDFKDFLFFKGDQWEAIIICAMILLALYSLYWILVALTTKPQDEESFIDDLVERQLKIKSSENALFEKIISPDSDFQYEEIMNLNERSEYRVGIKVIEGNYWRAGLKLSENKSFAKSRQDSEHPLVHLFKDENDSSVYFTYYNLDGTRNPERELIIRDYDNSEIQFIYQRENQSNFLKIVYQSTNVFTFEIPQQYSNAKLTLWTDISNDQRRREAKAIIEVK